MPKVCAIPDGTLKTEMWERSPECKISTPSLNKRSEEVKKPRSTGRPHLCNPKRMVPCPSALAKQVRSLRKTKRCYFTSQKETVYSMPRTTSKDEILHQYKCVTGQARRLRRCSATMIPDLTVFLHESQKPHCIACRRKRALANYYIFS